MFDRELIIALGRALVVGVGLLVVGCAIGAGAGFVVGEWRARRDRRQVMSATWRSQRG